jgi:hypothetical protein
LSWKDGLPPHLRLSVCLRNIFSLLAIFTAFSSEEDESVFWTLDIAIVTFFWSTFNKFTTE